MDPIEELRKAYRAEVEDARQDRKATPVTVRTVRETVPADLTEAMLDQMLVDADTFETAVRLSLHVLGDEAAAPAVRLTALLRLGGAAFQPVAFAPFHAEYVERLREVAVGDDRELRMTALDRLTLMDDEVGQRLLRESLAGRRKPLLSAASAAGCWLGTSMAPRRRCSGSSRARVRRGCARRRCGPSPPTRSRSSCWRRSRPTRASAPPYGSWRRSV